MAMAERAAVASSGAEELLSLAEAAQVLGISQRTAQRLLDREELKATKVGRQWRFRREDLSAYLNRERAPFAQAPAADLEQALRAASDCLGDPDQALAGLDLPDRESANDGLFPGPLGRLAHSLIA